MSLTPSDAGGLDKILIDTRNWGRAPDERSDYMTYQPGHMTFIDDPLRDANGSYWYPGRSLQGGIYVGPNIAKFLNPLGALGARSHPLIPSHYPFELEVGSGGETVASPMPGGTKYFGDSQEVIIRARPGQFHGNVKGRGRNVYRGSLFEEYVNGGENRPIRVIEPNEIYSYNAFALNTPMFAKEAESYADLKKPRMAGAKAEYMYYTPEFEQKSQQISELWLPNLYMTYLTKAAIEDDPSLNEGGEWHDFMEHTNLFGFFPEELNKNTNDYFGSWVKAYEGMEEIDPAPILALERKLRNIVFDPDEMKKAKSLNTFKNLFPFFTEIQFTTDPAHEFIGLLKKTRLDDRFMVWLMGLIGQAPGYPHSRREQFMEQTEQIAVEQPAIEGEESPTPSRIIDLSMTGRISSGLDEFSDWMEEFDEDPQSADQGPAFALQNSYTVLSQHGSSGLSADENNRFERNLLTRIFHAKLKQFARRWFMRWDSSFGLNNSPRVCHSETVAYRVEKRKLGPDRTARGEVIQNFYCLNLEDIGEVEFIDTQVAYDNWYQYTIYSYQIVYGTEYMYMPPQPVSPIASGRSARNYGNIFVSDDDYGTSITRGELSLCFPLDLAEGAAIAAGIGAVADVIGGGPGDVVVGGGGDVFGPAGGAGDDPLSGINAQVGVAGINAINAANQDRIEQEQQLEDTLQRQIDAAAAETERVTEYRFCVHSRPYIHLVEVPYKTFEPTKVVDNHPAVPHMTVVPYRQITDKVLINLNMAVDDYVDDPITILEEDQEQFDDVRLAMDLRPSEPIRFKSDDTLGSSGHFEVWKTTTRPESYEDFANAELSVVFPSEHSQLNPSSGALSLTVHPNRKYYICARMIDVHGKVSNPTEVYEIEIVYEDGVMFFRKETIELKALEPPKQKTKQVKKFVRIAPNLIQSLISTKEDDGVMNADSATGLTSVKLGEARNDIWGRKFKVRFVSKDTGRKIDLNLDFSVSHDRILAPDEI